MAKGARLVISLLLAVALGACSGNDDDATDSAGEATTIANDSTTTSPSSTVPEPDPCPTGYEGELTAGEHSGFASAEQDRSFHLLLPDDGDDDGPHPLFVALTGTVQEERAFVEQSRLGELTADGWIVVAPVRNFNGTVWPPWDDLRRPGDTRVNADVTFITDLVACLGARLDVDAQRVFVGGISAGGAMTNRLLRERSDVFAGGIVGSGNFVLTDPAEPAPLDDLTVIVAWGGDNDRWVGCADGRMGAEVAGEPGCVDVSFVADASAASQYYASEPNVRHIACSADVGHIWNANATAYWAELLAASPKGTDEAVDLGTPPAGVTCSTEAFVQ